MDETVDQVNPQWVKTKTTTYDRETGKEMTPEKLAMVRQLAQRDAQQRAKQNFLRQNPQVAKALEAQRMEQEQKLAIDAASFEKRYTFKQKQEYTQRQNALKAMEANPDFSPEEKAGYRRMVQLQNAQMKPVDMMKAKPTTPGRGPGDDYIDEKSGNHIFIGMDGAKKVATMFSKTRPGMAETDLRNIQKEKLREQSEIAKEIRAFKAKLLADPFFTGDRAELDRRARALSGASDPDGDKAAPHSEVWKEDAPGESSSTAPQTKTKATPPPIPTNGPVLISSKAEYEALKLQGSGIKFTKPDGSTWETP